MQQPQAGKGTGKGADSAAGSFNSYQREMAFDWLPLKHHAFDEWEASVRYTILINTPSEFPHERYFDALSADQKLSLIHI